MRNDGKTITAGFVQNAPVFGDVQRNLEHVEQILGDARADLLVLPELFATGYQFRDGKETAELAEPAPGGPTSDFVIRLARARRAYVVAGLAERDGGALYNTAIIAGPQGYLGKYRKAHVFDSERDLFEPGDLPLAVFDAGTFRIGIMICYDWRFPETARTLALRGADIIAHPSNLVLPHCPQAMITRCLENRVYAVTADRVGIEERIPGERLRFMGQSQITAPDGRILIRASEDAEEFHIVTLDPATARDKKINRRNDLFADRRTDLYQLD
jgi:predicted amidohydrolase